MPTEQPCRHCAGTGTEIVTSLAELMEMPFQQDVTVAERWEVVRDLVGRPSIGQLAYLANSGKKLRWAGEGWVEVK
jgi:hypothetical protein